MGSVRPLCSQPSYDVVTENHPDLHSFGAAGGFTEVVDADDHDAVVGVLAPAAAAEGAERVLAVGAHPDDVEIGCGATLLRHSQQGHPVTV
ncbi:PIG-L deacetylase family protein [Williamsia muralis]|uniref:PIG-L deacetylase family protein n=1 Tax=Williamsia marianensis TaxID=85044 RepID=UPI001B87FFA0|nr:PIG-L family deacetylase [Williamsia muralis]